MDSAELNQRLQLFFKKCDEIGYGIEHYSFEEAYPGDSSTSYVVNVKAAWLDNLSTAEALDILFDTLWETTDADTRINVFAIKLIKQRKTWMSSETITRNNEIDDTPL
jgi:hypothetical protein